MRKRKKKGISTVYGLRTTDYDFRPRKSLGQNFLRNPHYLRLIAESAALKKGDCVLEVGPGEGALTKELLARGANVVAVEKDRRLIPLLRERFAGQALTLVEGDALDFEPSDYSLLSTNYKLVANIPYYITGALLRKFLTNNEQPSMMMLLVQKEVAERIARDKKESLLSLSIKAYGSPRYVATVPRGAFHPKPGVDSAILAVEDISRRNFAGPAQAKTSQSEVRPTPPGTAASREKRFFELLHAGFSSKRKFLRRNLEKILGKEAGEALERAEIPQNARAEDVPLKKWLELTTLG